MSIDDDIDQTLEVEQNEQQSDIQHSEIKQVMSFTQKNRHEKWLMNNQTRTQKEFDTR